MLAQEVLPGNLYDEKNDKVVDSDDVKRVGRDQRLRLNCRSPMEQKREGIDPEAIANVKS